MKSKSRKAIIQRMLKAHSMYYVCKLTGLKDDSERWLSQLLALMNLASEVSFYERDIAMLRFYRACRRVVE